MKKVLLLVIITGFFLFLNGGCKKKEVSDQTPPPPVKAGQVVETASDSNTTVNAEVNCGKAYDFMKAFIDQIEEQMAKQGEQIPNKKEFPPKEKFIKACKELPNEIIVCLDMEYSMKHQEECQNAKNNADPEKMKKFEEMLR